MSIHIRPLDLVVIIVYLLGMACVGVWFSKRNKSTEEYFVGSRSFPGWAIGLSMLGTSISSVTFLAFPAAAYVLDWRQLVSNLMLPAVAVLAIVVFIPFFRRGQLTSAFEYLEDRFGPSARLYGTLSFILLQLIRLAKVLFLVSIPVSLLTGIEMSYVIIAVGVFIAFYTVAGGFDAVIWTDVVQAVVLWFGGLLCFGSIAWNLPEGPSQIFSVAAQHDKFHLGSMDFNIGERTFWTVALIGVFNWLAMYSSDQNVVQRYVAAKSLRDARRATTLYSVVAVPTWAFFFFLGTCVFVWYQVHPDAKVANLEADQVFPYFILTTIPAGLAGLTIAGVLAAAMSSLDSSINAIATVTTVDLVKPYLAHGRDDQFYLRIARWIATIAAALMIGGAMLFASIEKESMNDLSWIVASVFGGCLVGLFMVGFFTRRVDGFSAMTALVVSVLLNVYLGLSLAGWLPDGITMPVHSYWVGIIVNLAFVVIAYTVSLFRGPGKELKGLTVWSMER
ncbi:MAG: sodium:solute symporter [Planctomycetia bacterium]|nr:sodium:solute symporter [Planctomycetia bacterium]